MKKIFLYALLISMAFISCKKGEDISLVTNFVDVTFDADRVALRNNGQELLIAAKYNGHPIDWDVTGSKKMRVVVGEGKFEFYNLKTGAIVGERTIDIKPGADNSYTLFQPTMEAPVSFIDPEAQNQEEAAPAGHIKLKVANYAQYLIPFSRVDIKVYVNYLDDNWNDITQEIGTIQNIGTTVDEGEYHILPDGLPDVVPSNGYGYMFEIIDSSTGESLKNYGGMNYTMAAFSPIFMDPVPVKNVFSIYLVSQLGWGEAPHFIKKGDDFYEVAAQVLYAN